jgi:hypothetical protein
MKGIDAATQTTNQESKERRVTTSQKIIISLVKANIICVINAILANRLCLNLEIMIDYKMYIRPCNRGISVNILDTLYAFYLLNKITSKNAMTEILNNSFEENAREYIREVATEVLTQDEIPFDNAKRFAETYQKKLLKAVTSDVNKQPNIHEKFISFEAVRLAIKKEIVKNFKSLCMSFLMRPLEKIKNLLSRLFISESVPPTQTEVEKIIVSPSKPSHIIQSSTSSLQR